MNTTPESQADAAAVDGAASMARLHAAVHETQEQLHELRCLHELLSTVGRSFGGSRDNDEAPPSRLASADSTDPLTTPAAAAGTTPAGNHLAGQASVLHTGAVAETALSSEFWRTWRREAAADSLFHHCGLSTSFLKLERLVTDLVVRSCAPQLTRLRDKVDRVALSVARSGQRAVEAQDARQARVDWIADAVDVLVQAAALSPPPHNDDTACADVVAKQPCSPETLWTDIEDGLRALAVSGGLDGAAPATEREEAIWAGRLGQQQQRILALLREMVQSVADSP